MIERFWFVARLVCLVRGHRERPIGLSQLNPTVECRRCARTRRVRT